MAFEPYIALGSLKWPAEDHVNGVGSASWTELSRAGVDSSSGHSVLRQHDLQRSLQRLLESKLIRLSAKVVDRSCWYRVFILPDDAGKVMIMKNTKLLRADLESLLESVNISPSAWLAQSSEHEPFQACATSEDGSLFYIFNTLCSPAPQPQLVHAEHSRQAMLQLLNTPDAVPSLRSSLYPYQARSAAAMIQHETTSALRPDPRLESRTAPDGREYWFMPRDLAFFGSEIMYETNKAGILAETMGLGKTVICLAMILATRHHLPLIPPQYSVDTLSTTGDTVPTLLNLALTTAARHSVPAKAYFHSLQRDSGQNFDLIMKRIDEAPPLYHIPGVAPRNNRRTQTPPPRRMILCSGTIIVVPRNLLNQWKAEIKKHVRDGPDELQVLFLDGNDSIVPPADQLRHFDVVLFSKSRFQREIKHGTDQMGRNMENTFLDCHCPYIGATRIRDCTCLKESDIYRSPLQELHWLRIIIDEGHEFSSATSDAVIVAQKLVVADRRWIVSGTPAKDKLHGIEVDLVELNSSTHVSEHGLLTPRSESHTNDFDSQNSRERLLKGRKQFQPQEDTGSSTAAKSIGTLVSHFLQIQPWSRQAGHDKIEWDDYIYTHQDYRRKTYSAYSTCLRRVLDSIVIKTRPEDVERDITLPSLTHKIIRLQPSFYDKLTANLFVLFLTSNAVCSERSDQDYLFHKNSTSARHQLITNLRQSNFFWTGFTAQNITSAVETSRKYLEKDNISCTPEDRRLLKACVEFSEVVLKSPEWLAMSTTHELALAVRDWPDQTLQNWSLVGDASKPLVGAGPLHLAQVHVNDRLFEEHPFEKLAEVGEGAMKAVNLENEGSQQPRRLRDNQQDAKLGVPASAMRVEPAKRTLSISAKPNSNKSPSKRSAAGIKVNKDAAMSPQKMLKRKRELDEKELPADSSLRDTSVVGTVSAKLSYLLNKIIEFHETEKIIVFYDGNNAAYYLAQCLELLHVKHLIYAKTLQNEVKSRYIVAFDKDESIRVLLMDVRVGAYGLNVNKASRVFFINPVCKPSTEAQAIKRAHRIGQTRPVFVETLVLEGSMEELMLERSRKMTAAEHQNVGQLDDDKDVAKIIQSATLMPLFDDELEDKARMAPLEHPIQVFGRKGRGDTIIQGIDKHEDRNDRRNAKKRKTGDERTAKKTMVADERVADELNQQMTTNQPEPATVTPTAISSSDLSTAAAEPATPLRSRHSIFG